MAGQLYVSYVREDAAYVGRLVGYLEDQGFTVWADQGLRPDARYDPALEAPIKASAAMLLVMTPESQNSPLVRGEIICAHAQDRPIVPLLLAGKAYVSQEGSLGADVSDGSMPDDDLLVKLGDLAGVRVSPRRRADPPTPWTQTAASRSDREVDPIASQAALFRNPVPEARGGAPLPSAPVSPLPRGPRSVDYEDPGFGPDPRYGPSYGADDHRSDDYRSDDHRSDDHRAADYRADDHRGDGYRSDDYRGDEYRSDGYRRDDYASADRPTDDHRPDDHRGTGYRDSGYPVDEHGADDYAPAGYGPVAYGPADYEPTGYAPTGYEPDPYSPGDYGPHDQSSRFDDQGFVDPRITVAWSSPNEATTGYLGAGAYGPPEYGAGDGFAAPGFGAAAGFGGGAGGAGAAGYGAGPGYGSGPAFGGTGVGGTGFAAGSGFGADGYGAAGLTNPIPADGPGEQWPDARQAVARSRRGPHGRGPANRPAGTGSGRGVPRPRSRRPDDDDDRPGGSGRTRRSVVALAFVGVVLVITAAVAGFMLTRPAGDNVGAPAPIDRPGGATQTTPGQTNNAPTGTDGPVSIPAAPGGTRSPTKKPTTPPAVAPPVTTTTTTTAPPAPIPPVTVAVPATMAPNSSVAGTVSIDAAFSATLSVSFSASVGTVSAGTVTIPAGSLSAPFTLVAGDVTDLPVTVTVTATFSAGAQSKSTTTTIMVTAA